MSNHCELPCKARWQLSGPGPGPAIFWTCVCWCSCDCSPKHHNTNISICLRVGVKRWRCTDANGQSNAPNSTSQWDKMMKKRKKRKVLHLLKSSWKVVINDFEMMQKVPAIMLQVGTQFTTSCRCCGKCRSRKYKQQTKREGNLEMRLIV